MVHFVFSAKSSEVTSNVRLATVGQGTKLSDLESKQYSPTAVML